MAKSSLMRALMRLKMLWGIVKILYLYYASFRLHQYIPTVHVAILGPYNPSVDQSYVDQKMLNPKVGKCSVRHSTQSLGRTIKISDDPKL